MSRCPDLAIFWAENLSERVERAEGLFVASRWLGTSIHLNTPGQKAVMMSSSSTTALRRNGSFFESTPKVQYPTSASEYVVLEEIGRGVSAKVYRATCTPLGGEQVAVKMLDLEDQDPGHLEEIRREVASMSMVSHPNLVMAHCSFVDGQFLWVVMPFLSGGSALNIMKWSHPRGLDETSIATILKEVLKALDYFHRNGNIHRDIKAGNVLIDADGSVKLADFGVRCGAFPLNTYRLPDHSPCLTVYYGRNSYQYCGKKTQYCVNLPELLCLFTRGHTTIPIPIPHTHHERLTLSFSSYQRLNVGIGREAEGNLRWYAVLDGPGGDGTG